MVDLEKETLDDELSLEDLEGVKAGMDLRDPKLRAEYEDYIRNLVSSEQPSQAQETQENEETVDGPKMGL